MADEKTHPIQRKSGFQALFNPENCIVVPRRIRNKRRLLRICSSRQVFPVIPEFLAGNGTRSACPVCF